LSEEIFAAYPFSTFSFLNQVKNTLSDVATFNEFELDLMTNMGEIVYAKPCYSHKAEEKTKDLTKKAREH